MPPQVVRPQMNPHQGAGLSDHDPRCGCGIGDRENSLVSFSASGLEVILQPVGELLGDEHRLCTFSTLVILDRKFLIIHIHGGKLQDLAPPHATPGHELQHEAVSRLGGTEDNLVDGLFLMDLPSRQFPRPKKFLQHGSVTRVWELGIQVVADEVKKGFEVGIAGVPG